MPSIVRPVVPQSDPLCHIHPRMPSDGSAGNQKEHTSVEPLSTCGIHGLPRRAWWGSGASRHLISNDAAIGHRRVQQSESAVVSCVSLVRSLRSLQRRPHWAAVLRQRSQRGSVGGGTPSEGRSPHGLAEWHKRLPPRLGGIASSWSARGRRHTGNGHGRLISPVHQRRRADHRRRPRK